VKPGIKGREGGGGLTIVEWGPVVFERTLGKENYRIRDLNLEMKI